MIGTGQATLAVKILPLSLCHRDAQTTLHMSDVPPRRRRYGLAPREMGTVWVESLTSYINRLGWRHGVSPRALVAQEIVPHLTREHWLASSPGSGGAFSWGGAMSMNGTGVLASEWSEILEQQTQRTDLHFLTLHWWRGNLASHGHLRASPAWCPMCYSEWQEQEQPIYQPLLWMLRVVTTCTKHNRLLESHCSSCQKKQSVIALRSSPGYCTQCNGWLGMPPGEKLLRKMKGRPVYWQQWVLQALAELRMESATNGILQWEPFFTSLAAGLDTATDLVLWEKVERFTRVKSQVLREWLKLRQTPPLEDILKFCYVCKVTPLQVMRGEVFPLVEAIEHGTPYRRSRHPLQHAARLCVDRERCRQMLQLVLNGHEKPLSLRQLAER